jgi:hypothetical protein
MAAELAERADILKATMALALVGEEPLDIQELAALVAPAASTALPELMGRAAVAAALGVLDNMTRIQ